MTRVLAAASLLALITGCGPSPGPTIAPESIDTMVLYASADELLVTVLDAMRKGDVATVRPTIASEGQIEAMCHDYTVGVTPYTQTNLDAATARCQQMLAATDEASFLSAIRARISGPEAPELDGSYAAHWTERCPDLKLYQVVHVIETSDDPDAPYAGFEVSDVFEYRGQWGLMTIPRCRAEGE